MTNTEQLYPLPVRLTATLLLAGLLFAACEESVTDTSIVLPYVEEIVVQGFLTAGATEGDTLFITRTLPPLERWTIERAAVSEAEVFVTVDGRRQEMRHIGNGLWIPDSWNVESGRQYNLGVRSGNLEVRSTTLVPADRIVDRTFRLDTVDGNGNGCRIPPGELGELAVETEVATAWAVAQDEVTGGEPSLHRLENLAVRLPDQRRVPIGRPDQGPTSDLPVRD